MELQIGQNIDRYTVEAILGEGACGVVYRVRHTRLGSQHALKVLIRTPRSMQIRLAQEGKIQAGLRHPNIVPVTDIIDIIGIPGLIAEYIEGPDLDAWRRLNRPGPAAAERIFRHLLAGLAYAHSNGVIHRDLKPLNILVAQIDGEAVPRITDFGIAKVISEDSPELTRSQASMGSPRYMAPEQWRNSKDVDVRADIFSMGCILYELVCGQPAFDADNLPGIFQAASAARYTDPAALIDDLSPALRATIIGCLRPDRDQRLADCAAVRHALDTPPSAEALRRIIEEASGPRTLVPATQQAAETLAPLSEDETHSDEGSIDAFASTQEMLRSVRPRRTPWLFGGAVALILGMVAMASSMDFQRTEPIPEPIITVIEDPEPTTEGGELKDDVAVEEPEASSGEAAIVVVEEPEEATEKPARVSVVGSDGAVWLVQGDQRFELGEVPAGRYQIRATFSGNTVPAGAVSLRAGEQVTLKCDDIFQQCRRERL